MLNHCYFLFATSSAWRTYSTCSFFPLYLVALKRVKHSALLIFRANTSRASPWLSTFFGSILNICNYVPSPRPRLYTNYYFVSYATRRAFKNTVRSVQQADYRIEGERRLDKGWLARTKREVQFLKRFTPVRGCEELQALAYILRRRFSNPGFLQRSGYPGWKPKRQMVGGKVLGHRHRLSRLFVRVRNMPATHCKAPRSSSFLLTLSRYNVSITSQ